MTREYVAAAERALDDHDAFEREGDAFTVTTTPFEATVRVVDAGGTAEYHVTVRVPTIDAVVAGETVAPVVQEGWFETFERRLGDPAGAMRTDPETPIVRLDAERGTVTVETSFEDARPARGAAEAKAFVDFVEGTYVQGHIPGYDYEEPFSGLLARAKSRGDRG